MSTTRVCCRALFVALLACTAHAQLPDAKAQFEVASIKPAGPPPRLPTEDGNGFMVRTGSSGGPGGKDPGHFTGTSISLFDLIRDACLVRPYQVAAPAWTKSALFDVSAKVPQGATRAQLALMLQHLLAERFKLVLHKESKEVSGYELLAGKGVKLKEAVESAGSAPPETAPPDLKGLKIGPDGYMPVLRKPAPDTYSAGFSQGHRTYAMSAFTMAHLARVLTSLLGRPVTDQTGLTGKYDFELRYVDDTTPDAESGPTLVGAVQSQLGLKLEAKKTSIEMLVVDAAEKLPTEN